MILASLSWASTTGGTKFFFGVGVLLVLLNVLLITHFLKINNTKHSNFFKKKDMMMMIDIFNY